MARRMEREDGEHFLPLLHTKKCCHHYHKRLRPKRALYIRHRRRSRGGGCAWGARGVRRWKGGSKREGGGRG